MFHTLVFSCEVLTAAVMFRVVRLDSLGGCPLATTSSCRGRREGAQALLVRLEAPTHPRARSSSVRHFRARVSDRCRHVSRRTDRLRWCLPLANRRIVSNLKDVDKSDELPHLPQLIVGSLVLALSSTLQVTPRNT